MNKIDIMGKSIITTVIVIICIIIVGLYAAGEVNYFASKNVSEKNITSPVIVIDKVGINEKINNVSLSQGVMLDEKSGIPTQGDVVIFGHRTLQGSPFLRLNELAVGDSITLEWPGIGEVKYTVTNTKIVPATYQLDTNQNGNRILLITCDPIGSTENRLIIEGELSNIGKINEKIITSNPQEANAYIISVIFMVVGLIIAFIYPRESRTYILVTVIIISAMLLYFCINPISSQIIYDHLIFLNGGL